jgi:uncharacterized protein (DUF433 family)
MYQLVSTINFMSRLVGLGIYDASEISFLLGTSPERIVNWSLPDQRNLPPIVSPYLDSLFTFEDLVSFAVALHLHKRGISVKDLRNGIESLRRHSNLERPLANQSVIDVIATSGSSFLIQREDEWLDIGRGGQGTFNEVVRVYLKGITFDQIGVAHRWNAALGVVIDPTIQAGTPCIEGTRIPTSTIRELLEDESINDISDDLQVTSGQIEAARDFEEALASGRGLIAA